MLEYRGLPPEIENNSSNVVISSLCTVIMYNRYFTMVNFLLIWYNYTLQNTDITANKKSSQNRGKKVKNKMKTHGQTAESKSSSLLFDIQHILISNGRLGEQVQEDRSEDQIWNQEGQSKHSCNIRGGCKRLRRRDITFFLQRSGHYFTAWSSR